MKGERVIAGVSCGDVLAELSDYLGEALSQERRAQIDAHLCGCDSCERFDGEFGAIVTALRRSLRTPNLAEGNADRTSGQ